MSETKSLGLSIVLEPDVAEELRRLAERENRSVASVARSVLANGLFVLKTTGEGNRVLVEDRAGTRRPLTPA